MLVEDFLPLVVVVVAERIELEQGTIYVIPRKSSPRLCSHLEEERSSGSSFQLPFSVEFLRSYGAPACCPAGNPRSWSNKASTKNSLWNNVDFCEACIFSH